MEKQSPERPNLLLLLSLQLLSQLGLHDPLLFLPLCHIRHMMRSKRDKNKLQWELHGTSYFVLWKSELYIEKHGWSPFEFVMIYYAWCTAACPASRFLVPVRAPFQTFNTHIQFTPLFCETAVQRSGFDGFPLPGQTLKKENLSEAKTSFQLFLLQFQLLPQPEQSRNHRKRLWQAGKRITLGLPCHSLNVSFLL